MIGPPRLRRSPPWFAARVGLLRQTTPSPGTTTITDDQTVFRDLVTKGSDASSLWGQLGRRAPMKRDVYEPTGVANGER
jgi:hypothetical protein